MNINEVLFKYSNIFTWAEMVQWWERSPPTNVSQVWFLDSASYMGWVCCWFSTLLREVFLRVLWFSPLHKNKQFQIPIQSWNARTFLNEFLLTPWCSVYKQNTFNNLYCTLIMQQLWYKSFGKQYGLLYILNHSERIRTHSSVLNLHFSMP